MHASSAWSRHQQTEKDLSDRILFLVLRFSKYFFYPVSPKFVPFPSRASDYGLMKIDSNGRVIQFMEKPRGADLEGMVSQALCVLQLHIWCRLFYLLKLVMLECETERSTPTISDSP